MFIGKTTNNSIYYGKQQTNLSVKCKLNIIQ